MTNFISGTDCQGSGQLVFLSNMFTPFLLSFSNKNWSFPVSFYSNLPIRLCREVTVHMHMAQTHRRSTEEFNRLDTAKVSN